MTMSIKTKKTTAASNLELVNTLGAGLGLPACTDADAFIAMLDGKIDAGKAELSRLANVRDAAARLAGRRRIRGPWTPGANTVAARIADLLKQHTTLTRPQIAVLLAAENAGEVPLGSISASLSKLSAEGWIEGGWTGWRLAGEDAGATE